MYGISLAAIKQPDGMYKVASMGGFDSLYWRIAEDKHDFDMPTLEQLNRRVINHLNGDPEGYWVVSEEKLITAPCDVVVVIDGESEYHILQDRKPIYGGKLHEHLK